MTSTSIDLHCRGIVILTVGKNLTVCRNEGRIVIEMARLAQYNRATPLAARERRRLGVLMSAVTAALASLPALAILWVVFMACYVGFRLRGLSVAGAGPN